MAKITNAQIFNIEHQNDVDSYPLRTNFANIKNRHNELVDTVAAASIGTTNAETTAARPYHTSLKSRIDAIQLNQENYVKDGFEVSVNAGDSTKINVTQGKATVGGIEVEKGYGTWSRTGTTITITEYSHGRANSSVIDVTVSSDTDPLVLQEYTVSNVATNTFDITGVDTGDLTGSAEYSTISSAISNPTTARYDIVVINSDNTLSIVSGNDSADRVNPNIASTQRPLAVIDVVVATGGPIITDSEIIDISTQGCVTDYGWYFNIQAAIDSFNDRDNSINQGTVTIRKGNYYEEVDLSGLNNITLQYENGAKHYRPDDSGYCIKSVNTISNETTGIKIIRGEFYGNSKIGAIELLKFEYTDEFLIKDSRFDSNDSSTATNKNWLINQCDNFFLDHNLNLDNTGAIDYAETDITSSTNYQEDGYYTGQVSFCGTTGQKAQMIKQGWIELSAMDDKFLRIDKDTAGTTGGNDTKDLEHNHAWFTAYNNKDISDTTYDSTGTESDITVGAYPSSGSGVAIEGKIKNNTALSHFTGSSADLGAYTSKDLSATQDIKPAFYSLIALIHR